MYQIQRIKCGNGNCYLVSQDNRAVLVDTAQPKYRDKILEACKGKEIQLIILTHAHMDHSMNAAYLAEKLHAPVAMSIKDEELLKNNLKQELAAKTPLGRLLLFFSIQGLNGNEIPAFQIGVPLKEGDSLKQYGIDASIIELPGHTDGSIGIELEQDVLVGDALMNMFYPTISMLYHDEKQMKESAARISSLGKKRIHFGHGRSVWNRDWIKR